MTTVAVVQARMGSTRLPGKVLMDVGGRSMLARVVRRTRRAATLDRTIVATTGDPADDAVCRECERLGTEVFRGSPDDVLDRTLRAADACGATAIVRITADCPLVDPGVIDRVVAAFRRVGVDYASNTLERTYPRGLDCEVVARSALEQAGREAREPYQRAHVTPFIYQHPERFSLLPVKAERDASRHRWTVDTAEDLELVRALYRRLGERDDFGWQEALAVVEREPALAALNQKVAQRVLTEV